MQLTNLRFRRRKALIGAGLVLGLLAMPLFQATKAASNSVTLDTTYSSRVYSGPGGATDFANTTKVQHGNVVQFGIFVHNIEDYRSDLKAKNAKLHVTIPRGYGNPAVSRVSVTADNSVPRPGYRQEDSTTLSSTDSKPFALTGVRNVQIQHNNVSPTNTPTFNWGTPQDVPDSRIVSHVTDNEFSFDITPNADGDLGPCFQNAIRIIFLADVTQPIAAPQLQLQKLERIGAGSFVKENTAKVGDKIQYFVELRNIGGSTATNVTLRDALPSKVALIKGSVQYRTSADATLQPGDDNFTNGGFHYNNIGAGGWVQVYFNGTIGDVPEASYWVKNYAFVKSDQTNGNDYYDSVKTTITKEVPKTGELKVVKYIDANGNKTQDAGEVAQGNVTFHVTGPAGYAKDLITGTDGTVSVNGLAAGSYTVTEVVPTGYENTTGVTQTVNVVADDDPATVAVATFGNKPVVTPKAGFTVHKFIDANGDGSIQVGENGQANVSFTITGPNGYNQTKQSDGSGNIVLANLEAGTYTVTETVPSGYTVTTPNPQTITLSANDSGQTLNFGNKPDEVCTTPATISATVKDNTNAAVSNVSVKITGPGNVNQTMQTDTQGAVSFGNLAAGTYAVSYTVPSGYTASGATSQNVSVELCGSGAVAFTVNKTSTPTPTPTPTVTPTPTPTPPGEMKTPPPVPSGKLPVTGTSLLVLLLTTLGLSGAYYGYRRYHSQS